MGICLYIFLTLGEDDLFLEFSDFWYNPIGCIINKFVLLEFGVYEL
jgi:hypothetical protein